MNKIIKSLLFFVAFAAFTVSVQAQKFGYINSQELIGQMAEVKEANAKIETLKKQLQKKGQDMITTLQAKYTALQKKQTDGTVAPKEFEAEAALLKEEESKLATFEQTSQQKIMEKSDELLSPIQLKINNAIKEVATDNGYTYIFDISLGLVLYADPGTDVSALVKAKLGI
ncbi:MAG: OmpH family outer membrane protein [Saprospiraceae bacterium]|nr:OmpH family outer membrane protein [Saprospiraceae bacterium]